MTSARERAEQLRLQEEARARRTKTLIVTLTSLVVAALLVGVFVVVQNERQKQALAEKGPARLGAHGGLVTGQESAKVTVTTYFDYLCPACKQFEQTYADRLQALEDQGLIKQERVPIAILDQVSNGSAYSTRSAAAGYCVMDSDRDKFAAFTKGMFAEQPPENTEGLTNAKIAEIAAAAGVSTQGQKLITDGKYTGYAAKVTDDASKLGYETTPTVLVNDKPLRDEKKQRNQSLESALKQAGVALPAA